MKRRLHAGDLPGTSLAEPLTPADELFAAVDGQIVERDGATWQLQVSGIHSDRGRQWVQLHLIGPQKVGATLRTTSSSPREILDLVDAWLRSGEPAAVRLDC